MFFCLIFCEAVQLTTVHVGQFQHAKTVNVGGQIGWKFVPRISRKPHLPLSEPYIYSLFEDSYKHGRDYYCIYQFEY